MNVLYVGDIMADAGIAIVARHLPEIRRKRAIDVVVAQAENVTQGKGISLADFAKLRKIGVDVCTGGNWSLYQNDIIQAMNDPSQPIIRPANYPAGTPGLGHTYVSTHKGDVLVISLLGHIVGKDADKPTDNPLRVIDDILTQEKDRARVATIVNLHGDFSSEKRIIGYYLDGRVSVVVGDHWHVPTADTSVLPKGTAHMTDVGMCGSLDSSLGVSLASVIPRWRDGTQTRNELETTGRMQFNALLAEIDEQTGLASAVEHIQIIEG